jgi:hypothetical protein
MRALAFAAHDAVEVPEDVEFLGPDRVFAENLSGSEIGLQTFQNDHVRGDQQEGLRIVLGDLVLLPYGIEVLPGDRQRHNLCLAAARGHFCAIAGKAVFWRKMKLFDVLGVAL